MMFPLRLGEPADFARVAKALRTSGFSEAVVNRALRGSGQSVLGTDAAEAESGSPDEPNVLLKLFIGLTAVPRAEVERALDRATLESFLALDLIRANADAYESPVFLYPVEQVLIASDHYNKSSGSDSVFPAIQSGTLHLLKLMSREPVEDALDLCCGTGICGLVLSKTAKRVVAADVTERAGHFARFNRLLNDCLNLEIGVGDLYSPVDGRVFDRIVAHPPYVPSVDESKIWRDGGSTGEAITKRIVEGLPRHLKPGGEFLALCLGSEQEDAPFQQRLRGWLGPAESEFNVIVATQKLLSPQELARQLANREDRSEEKAELLEGAFRQAGVKRFCYGVVSIRRHQAAGLRPWTMRTRLGSGTRAESFDAVFRRSSDCSQPQFVEKMRPRPQEGVKATLAHIVEAEKFMASELVLETEFPFEQTMRLQPWVFRVLGLLDGNRTVEEAFVTAREGGILPEGCESEHFVELVAMLAMQGYLTYGGAT